jgi:transcriptional regulator with XRE-family HTH domain
MIGRKPGRPRGRKPGAGRIEKAERLPPGIANPVDVHVGQRVRLRRTLLGLSQEKLGAAVGLTFQQIQKYERGANRIGASRLYEFSKILDVPVSYFFEEMPGELATHAGRFKAGLRDHDQEDIERDPLIKRETLELVRAYYRVPSARARKRLFELTKSLAGMPTGED